MTTSVSLYFSFLWPLVQPTSTFETASVDNVVAILGRIQNSWYGRGQSLKETAALFERASENSLADITRGAELFLRKAHESGAHDFYTPNMIVYTLTRYLFDLTDKRTDWPEAHFAGVPLQWPNGTQRFPWVRQPNGSMELKEVFCGHITDLYPDAMTDLRFCEKNYKLYPRQPRRPSRTNLQTRH